MNGSKIELGNDNFQNPKIHKIEKVEILFKVDNQKNLRYKRRKRERESFEKIKLSKSQTIK